MNIYISDNGIDPDYMALATVDAMKSIFRKLEEFLKIKAIFLATWGNGAVKVIMFNQIYKILKLLLHVLCYRFNLLTWWSIFILFQMCVWLSFHKILALPSERCTYGNRIM